MKNIFLLLLLSQFSYGQNLNDFDKTVEKFISTNYGQIKKNISKNYNELIGKTLLSDRSHNSFFQKIYFINDTYFLLTDGKQKILGKYKRVITKDISLIVLLNEYRRSPKGFIVALKENKKYFINWEESNGYYDSDTATIIQENHKNKELFVSQEIIPELNFQNPNIRFYVKNVKIGIKSKGQKIIKNECDSLYIYSKIATIFNDGKTDLYNLYGKLLEKNVKADYQYSRTEHQIIDSKNNMYFIDTLGLKQKQPRETHLRPGNDYIKRRTYITYYVHKNNILKTNIHSTYKERKDTFKKDSLKLYGNEPYQITTPNSKDEDFMKKVFKNKKEFNSEIFGYFLDDKIDSYDSEYIKLPKKFKKVRFTNNSTKRMQFNDDLDWYPYALKPSYIIAKKSTKYGVWDIEENKNILPFDYKKITVIDRSYFLLEKNGLYTFSNLGLTPKYKVLDNYIVQFAYFEYPDGKTGWVDKYGQEYFDINQ
ncbi:hypothetical protein [Aquimarina aquimarini]|uniref:hypothetical protein n=1 Tax=Aquimarina aquimarini TaxID=1191734 RepID=UPI000D55306F|nr:hypothetical protein [Aquimarina aquimarini]